MSCLPQDKRPGTTLPRARRARPRRKSPITPQRPAASRSEEERHRACQRQQQTERSLAEQRKKQVQRKQHTLKPDVAAAVNQVVKRSHRQRYEHAHEHVHAQEYGHAGKQSARKQQQFACAGKPLARFSCRPPSHRKRRYKCRNEREQRQKPHAMSAEQRLAGHQEPEIQRGVVGIRHAMIGKGEQRTVTYRLVGNA